MTDLSTTNLQRLLDQAAPGPWTALATYDDGAPRPDTTREMRAAGEYLGIMHTPNAELAAAAPDLAQEVLRLRRRLSRITTDRETVAHHEGDHDG